MLGIGPTEVLLFLTVATFVAIWKTFGPPRFGFVICSSQRP
jgi:hypothetical protein